MTADIDRSELTTVAHALIEGASIDIVPAYLIWLCQFDADDLLTMYQDIFYRVDDRTGSDRESFDDVVCGWIQSSEVLGGRW